MLTQKLMLMILTRCDADSEAFDDADQKPMIADSERMMLILPLTLTQMLMLIHCVTLTHC